MKKVLLVNTNTEKSPYPIPPLGLAMVAKSIENQCDVRIFDGMFEDIAKLVAVVEDFQPDYIGFGVRNTDDVVMGSGNYYIDDIKARFINPVRQVSTATTIIGGGAFSMFAGSMLTLFEADFGIVGQGEDQFGLLLEALEQGRDPTEIPGVISREDKGSKRQSFDPASGLLIVPDSQIDAYVDFEPYKQRSSYPVQTKRGCNQHCIYCSYPSIEGRSFRLRSPEDVVREIEGIVERLGDVTIEFVDSTFNSPKGHAEELCKAIIDRGLKLKLRTMGVNPGGITDELLSLMNRAGFSQIDCTPDSGSQTMLASLQKNFSIKELISAAELIKKHRMPTMWFFLFGGPKETEKTVNETFDFIDQYIDDLDMVHMTEGLRIFPNTTLANIALEEGVIKPGDDLLKPCFYVSKELSENRLRSLIQSKAYERPNCVPAFESSPDQDMIQQALALRKAKGLVEPMFRTFLRIRRERLCR